MKHPEILIAQIQPSPAIRFHGDEDADPNLMPDDDGPQADFSSLEAKFSKDEPKTEETKPEADKAKEPKEPEAKEPEKKVEAEPEKKVEAEPKVETKPDAKKPEDDTDEDVDKINLKPNAPSHIKEQFSQLKTITKTAKAAAKEAKAQVKTLTEQLEVAKTASASAELPAEVTEKLSRLEAAEAALERQGVMHHPLFEQKFESKVKSAEEKLKHFLTERNMSADNVTDFIDKGEAWDRKDNVLDALKSVPEDKKELELLLGDLTGTRLEKRKAVEMLDKNGKQYVEDFNKQLQEKESGHWKAASEAAAELVAAHKEILRRELPENANADQKKAIEAHNKVVDERSKEVANLIQTSIISRDPKSTAQLCHRAYLLPFVQSELTESKANAIKLQERIDELESKVKSVKNVSEMTRKETAAVTQKKSSGPNLDVTLDDAMDAHFKR